MSAAKAGERLPGSLAFRRIRRKIDDALPRLRRPIEILLAERADDPDVQQRLGVIRIELERPVELGQRDVRLVHVVVADPEIRADVDVLGIDAQRLLVPLDGITIQLVIEVQVAQLDAHGGILRVALCGRLERRDASLVKRRRRCRLRLGRLGFGSGWRRPRGTGLLAADNPADQEAEEHAGDPEKHRFFGHERRS